MKNNLRNKFVKGTSLVLVFAMAAMLAACGGTDGVTGSEVDSLIDEVVSEAVSEIEAEDTETVEEIETEETEIEEPEDEDTDDVAEATDEEIVEIEATEIGEGAMQFLFEVIDGEGNATYFTVNTDKQTVGEALVDCALIEGEDSAYGLYVKKVNGITADYDVDQTYWAFYINGEYATTGVDSTDVVDGNTYSFRVEK